MVNGKWFSIMIRLSSQLDSVPKHLTKRSSQPLAVPMRRFNFMKQMSMFATLAPASGGSAWSR
jgi:hypothetical protein